MNYLAHLYLADQTPESIVGNLMGDFVKGLIEGQYSSGLSAGIVLHRKVDSYCDQHSIVQRSRRRVRQPYRRYAGIIIDMFFDHFLALHWDRYSKQPLPSFAAQVYAVLYDRLQDLPPRMQRSVRYMLRNDLLMSYRDIAGIQRSLAGIERRLKRPFSLSTSISELKHDYAGFERDFEAFFPQLIQFAEVQKKLLHTGAP